MNLLNTNKHMICHRSRVARAFYFDSFGPIPMRFLGAHSKWPYSPQIVQMLWAHTFILDEIIRKKAIILWLPRNKQTNGINERTNERTGKKEQQLVSVETPAITLTTEKPFENEATKGNQINQHTEWDSLINYSFLIHSSFFSLPSRFPFNRHTFLSI